MFLSDKDIKEELQRGELKIEPFDEKNIQPASIDLRLGEGFLIFNQHTGQSTIKLNEESIYEKKGGSKIFLPSGEFVLATTLERIKIPKNIIAMVQGRSSIGRKGLFVQNAGWIDPGFEGNITLELFNPNNLPIEIKAGQRICQIIFAYLKNPSENPYDGKYQGQTGTTGSKSHADKEFF
tara:strand:+ start:286 stop:825 length:540 start_codon:yes stop_codon:yes gene_type:complete